MHIISVTHIQYLLLVGDVLNARDCMTPIDSDKHITTADVTLETLTC